MAQRGALVDTSVLIDYFGGVANRESRVLDLLLEQGPPPATAPIIVQEYLQGLKEAAEFSLASEDLESFDRLPPPDYPEHVEAADSHVRLRRKGLTIPTVDTLIVTLALRANRPLLTRDRHQRDLARFVGVDLA